MKSTFSLLFVCFLLGCNQHSNTKQQELPVIDIASGLEKGGGIKLSEYASAIEYIPLDTNMKVLLGALNRFNFRKQGNLYYYGCLDNKTCLVFKESGEYVGKIGQQGKAGDEFYTILDLEINPFTNELIIYDGNKLQVYAPTGEHKKTIQLDDIREGGQLHIRDFNLIGEFICLHVIQQPADVPGVVFLNADGKKIQADLPAATEKRQTEFQTTEGVRYRKRTALNSYGFNNQLTVINPLSDTLFAYTPQLEKNPRYVLNFGKYSVTLNPNTTYESDNILIFSILTHENQFDFYRPGLGYMLYDKKTKNTRILPYQKEANTSGFQNDLDHGAPFLPDGICGNQLYQVVNAPQFIDNNNRYNSTAMKKTATQLTENSNPVLVVVTLK